MTPVSFTPDILVIGGAHIDRIARSTARLEPEQSNPGTLTRNVGGVAGNIARCLAKLSWNVALSTISGQDDDAELLKQQLLAARASTCHSLLTRNPDLHRSATYTAIEDANGRLVDCRPLLTWASMTAIRSRIRFPIACLNILTKPIPIRRGHQSCHV